MTIQDAIGELSKVITQNSETINKVSGLSKTNSESIIKIVEHIGKQNTRISELEKQIQQLKSKLK
jgi:methyl-accepting chemotaxis protein